VLEASVRSVAQSIYPQTMCIERSVCDWAYLVASGLPSPAQATKGCLLGARGFSAASVPRFPEHFNFFLFSLPPHSYQL